MSIEVLLEGGPYNTLSMELDMDADTPVIVMPESFEEVFLYGADAPLKEYLYRLNERKKSGLLVYRFAEKRDAHQEKCDQTATKH